GPGLVEGWAGGPSKDRGRMTLGARQETRALREGRQQLRDERRATLTFPYSFNGSFCAQSFDGPPHGTQRHPTLRSQLLIAALGERALLDMRQPKEALVQALFIRRQIRNHFIHQLAICTHHRGPMTAKLPVWTSIFLHRATPVSYLSI